MTTSKYKTALDQFLYNYFYSLKYNSGIPDTKNFRFPFIHNDIKCLLKFSNVNTKIYI